MVRNGIPDKLLEVLIINENQDETTQNRLFRSLYVCVTVGQLGAQIC